MFGYGYGHGYVRALCVRLPQAKVVKGVRWMPWLTEAMKDVTSCDKRGLGANIR